MFISYIKRNMNLVTRSFLTFQLPSMKKYMEDKNYISADLDIESSNKLHLVQCQEIFSSRGSLMISPESLELMKLFDIG
jgi:hypothetical protein